MKGSLWLKIALISSCVIIMLYGCAYHKQKGALEGQIAINKKKIGDVTADTEYQQERYDNYKKTKKELEKEIVDLQVKKNSLQNNLARLQLEIEREKITQDEECGEKCQEVKALKDKIEAVNQSIAEKRSAIGEM